MSEPTVRIPLRLALHAARHFNATARFYEPAGAEACQRYKMALVDAISNQCTMDQINIAAIAADIETASIGGSST